MSDSFLFLKFKQCPLKNKLIQIHSWKGLRKNNLWHVLYQNSSILEHTFVLKLPRICRGEITVK